MANSDQPEITHEMKVFALHRYYVQANHMRARFDAQLSADGAAAPDDDRATEQLIDMGLWYGSLFVVVEGWQELHLADAEIDRLLDSANVDLLRRYRNGVFHYQPRYWDDRFVDFIGAADAVTWVRSLNAQFGRWFLEWFQAQRAADGSSTSS